MSTGTWAPGQTVRIREGVTDPAQGAVVPGAEYRIEDLWIKVCLRYALRAAVSNLPPSAPSVTWSASARSRLLSPDKGSGRHRSRGDGQGVPATTITGEYR